ncbi:MAG TPA: hypothetical protein VLB44_07350 [Kofleriaceae bacterium]|nr:hypothetical protein [Kofleriaceae bacterium]
MWKCAVLALVAGCVGPTMRDRHPGQLKLTFHNEAGGPVCGLYIYPFGQTAQGQNWLQPDTEIASGNWIEFWVSSETTYQFRVEGCPYEHQLLHGYAPSIVMNEPAVAVLYKEDDKRSKEVAEGLAHSHTNSTLIPAKQTFVAHPTARPTVVKTAPSSRGDR